ncbi:MAG TPA: hypothetical protein VEQ60_15000 [Longimicrobium sp.]|nr:hypothetical protein [Longimicrobium sp.]
MRNIRRIAPLMVLPLLAACASILGSDSIVGEWVHHIESRHGPWNRHEIRLELRADGSYTWGTTGHAEWGRPGDHLLGYSREHGVYEVEGDSLFLSAQRQEVWDYLTGQYESDLTGQPTARYRARASASRLILDFTSYPLDAPEETRMVLRRD